MFFSQRLAGASLLVFANKQDLPGAMSAEEIRGVSTMQAETLSFILSVSSPLSPGTAAGLYKDTSLDDSAVQCCHWRKTVGGR